MASFRKKDQIQHPTYGLGNILDIKKGSGSMLILDVDFPGCGIRKQLSALWVEQHCQHLTPRQAEASKKPPSGAESISRTHPCPMTSGKSIRKRIPLCQSRLAIACAICSAVFGPVSILC